MLFAAIGVWQVPAKAKAGLAAKIKSTEGNCYVDLDASFWIGNDEEWFHVYDMEDSDVYLDTLKQSKKVFTVNKEGYLDENDKKHYKFYIKPSKAGKTTITVTYTTFEGSTGKASFKLEVKKYPKAIKSLKVNGKKVKVEKKKIDTRFSYNLKYNKTSAKIKMALNNNWKIKKVWAIYEIGSGDYYETKKISKQTIAKGKKIKFQKKYDDFYVYIDMKNSKGNTFTYYVYFER